MMILAGEAQAILLTHGASVAERRLRTKDRWRTIGAGEALANARIDDGQAK